MLEILFLALKCAKMHNYSAIRIQILPIVQNCLVASFHCRYLNRLLTSKNMAGCHESWIMSIYVISAAKIERNETK